MKKIELLRFKNMMLLSNALANIIGISIVMLLSRSVMKSFPSDATQIISASHRVFIPFSLLIPILGVLYYERPIRKYLNHKYAKRTASNAEILLARQRLLNEPFFMILLNMAIWLAASIFYPICLWLSDQSWPAILQTFFMSLNTGLITAAVAFFVLEHILQRRLVPIFFTEGGLYKTPNTFRIHIGIRIGALVFACNFVPQMATIGFIFNASKMSDDPAVVLEAFRSALLVNAVTFILMGIWLAFIVSMNFRRPLREIIKVLQGVRKGRFDQQVRVTSNDEIGFAGDVINEMNSGLRERELIKDTFGKYVAREVRDEVLSGRVPLDGEKRDVSILFSNLRDFTPMTERTDPKQVIQIMNRYFEEMDGAIQKEGGLVLQFVGDGIYAVFGAPISRFDHPSRAFVAALEMRRRLAGLNREFARRDWPQLRHGIGIHSGDALAANMGSPDRLSYLLVGDTINLASRLQDLTKRLNTEIILSEATQLRLDPKLPSFKELRSLPPTPIKGKRKPVRIYALP